MSSIELVDAALRYLPGPAGSACWDRFLHRCLTARRLDRAIAAARWVLGEEGAVGSVPNHPLRAALRAVFVASIGAAFASIFLPWFRVSYGAIGIAISVALWLAFEVQIPREMNIRFELVFLFAMMLAAVISTVFAAASAKATKEP